MTEEQWREVFRLRCKGMRGESLATRERELVAVAFEEDFDRYAAMTKDVLCDVNPVLADAVKRRRSA